MSLFLFSMKCLSQIYHLALLLGCERNRYFYLQWFEKTLFANEQIGRECECECLLMGGEENGSSSLQA